MLTHGTSTYSPARDLEVTTRARLAASAFIAGYSNAKTRDAYAMHLRDWFRFCETHEVDPMEALRVHVDLWLRSLEQAGRKPRTRALKLTTIRSFYRYCCDEEWIVADPTVRAKGPRIDRRSPNGALNRTQLADLVAGARDISPSAYALVMLLGFNGLRIGETCAANIEDLAFDGSSPVLLLPNRKGGKIGDAPLARPTEGAINACTEGRTSGPLLLNQAERRMTRSNAQCVLDRAVENVRGKIPRLTPHTLRHTWTSLAVAAGVPTIRIQHDGGWSDQRLVDYYDHSQNSPLAATTHLVSAHVMSVA